MSRISRFHQGVTSLTLQGTGSSREEALAQILTRMRQQIVKEIAGTILFMAPVGMEVTRETVQSTTERFLGLLWPRTRSQVELEARIDVEVRWLQFLPGATEEGSR